MHSQFIDDKIILVSEYQSSRIFTLKAFQKGFVPIVHAYEHNMRILILIALFFVSFLMCSYFCYKRLYYIDRLCK